MNHNEIEQLIVKYLNRSASSDDMDFLTEWIQKPHNQDIFQDYVKTFFAVEMSMDTSDQDKLKEQLIKRIRKDKKTQRFYRMLPILKYAALALLFLSLGYIFRENSPLENTVKPIVPRSQAVTLELENGELNILKEDGSTDIISPKGEKVGIQKGNSLTYGYSSETGHLVYNTLRIPFGKRFRLVLSDGTTVTLNAGSEIKYPARFPKFSERQVFLSGEAYFQVSHDQDRPFNVISEDLSITVLGTSFNVANYPGDNYTDIVLVDGQVRLTPKDSTPHKKSEKGLLLAPSDKGSFDKFSKTITTETVNTALYTSWMSGNAVFRGVAFEDIIKKLERIYNVTIINNNKDLAKEKFNATVESDIENIEQVFQYFNKVYQINYSIIENKIVIN